MFIPEVEEFPLPEKPYHNIHNSNRIIHLPNNSDHPTYTYKHALTLNKKGCRIPLEICINASLLRCAVFGDPLDLFARHYSLPASFGRHYKTGRICPEQVYELWEEA